MKAQDLRMELELMMSRNLRILQSETERGSFELAHDGCTALSVRDVGAMLKSIAANIAQVYAARVVEEPTTEAANHDR
jgi:hypothetical protein